MTEHNHFYSPYASFTNVQLPLLKVAGLYLHKLVLLDPVGASWNTVGADDVVRYAVRLLKDTGTLQPDRVHSMHHKQLEHRTYPALMFKRT